MTIFLHAFELHYDEILGHYIAEPSSKKTRSFRHPSEAIEHMARERGDDDLVAFTIEVDE